MKLATISLLLLTSLSALTSHSLEKYALEADASADKAQINAAILENENGNWYKTECEVTPNIWELKAWPKSSKSSNLRRKTGSTNIANGDHITIEGVITDETCAPVANALVQIWQADSRGVMPGFQKDPRKPDENFLYTGTAITDNFGRYAFTTVFPGALKGRAPFVIFHITNKDFLDAETIMIFENQSLNGTDKILNIEVPQNKQDLLVAKSKKTGKYISQDDIKYNFDITLEGKNKYLRF